MELPFSPLLEQQNSELCPLNLDYLGRPCKSRGSIVKGLGAEHGIQPLTAYIPPYEIGAFAIAMLRGFNELILINYIKQNPAQVSPQL